MFDTETLRPVIIAMTFYIVIVKMVPEILKKPTGLKLIDEINMSLISQQGFIMQNAIIVGIITLLVNADLI